MTKRDILNPQPIIQKDIPLPREVRQKRALYFAAVTGLSLIIVFSGLTDYLGSYVLYWAGRIMDTTGLGLVIDYSAQIMIAVLLVFTPISLVSSVWFAKIGWDLIIGRHSAQNVFIISEHLNWVMAACCLMFAIFGIIEQKKWVEKLIPSQPGSLQEATATQAHT